MQAGDRFGEVIGSLHYLPEDDDDWSLYIGAPGRRGRRKAGGRLGDRGGRARYPQADHPEHLRRPWHRPRPATTSAPAWPAEAAAIAISWPSAPRARTSARSRMPAASPSSNAPRRPSIRPSAHPGHQRRRPAPSRPVTSSARRVAYRDDRTLAIGVPGRTSARWPTPAASRSSGSASRTCPSRRRHHRGLPRHPGRGPGRQPVRHHRHRVAGRRDGEAIFAISSPFQDGGSVYVISSDPTIDPRSWKPGTGHSRHRIPLRPIRRLTACSGGRTTAPSRSTRGPSWTRRPRTISGTLVGRLRAAGDSARTCSLSRSSWNDAARSNKGRVKDQADRRSSVVSIRRSECGAVTA